MLNKNIGTLFKLIPAVSLCLLLAAGIIYYGSGVSVCRELANERRRLQDFFVCRGIITKS